MSEIIPSSLIPAGVSYDWHADGDVQLIEAIHVHGKTLHVDHQLPPNAETATLLRVSGMEVGAISDLLHATHRNVAALIGHTCDILNVPKKPNSSRHSLGARTAAIVGRLCVPGGILQPEFPVPEYQERDEKCVQVLSLLGQGQDWGNAATTLGCTKSVIAHYFKNNYDHELVGPGVNSLTLLLHACSARILDPEQVVAAQGGAVPRPPYKLNWNLLRKVPPIGNGTAEPNSAMLTHPQQSVGAELDITDTAHPFSVMGENRQRMFIHSKLTDEIFPVSRPVGRILLALGLGVENGLTRAELSPNFHPDDPTFSPSPAHFRILMMRTRNAVAGRGPNIIRKPRTSVTDSTYYYENKIRPQDFIDWDVTSIGIHFNSATRRLTLVQAGEQRSTTITKPTGATLLEHLLNHPNEPVDAKTLQDVLNGAVYRNNNDPYLVISNLRADLQNAFGIDPHGLIACKQAEGQYVTYELRANSVRITAGEPDNNPAGEKTLPPGLNMEDISNIARGFILKQKDLHVLRRLTPDIDWPIDEHITSVAETDTIEPQEQGAIPGNSDDVVASLEKLKAALKDSKTQSLIQKWSPDNAHFKTFLLFLTQLDTVPYTIRKEQVRGIDVLAHILRRETTPMRR